MKKIMLTLALGGFVAASITAGSIVSAPQAQAATAASKPKSATIKICPTLNNRTFGTIYSRTELYTYDPVADFAPIGSKNSKVSINAKGSTGCQTYKVVAGRYYLAKAFKRIGPVTMIEGCRKIKAVNNRAYNVEVDGPQCTY